MGKKGRMSTKWIRAGGALLAIAGASYGVFLYLHVDRPKYSLLPGNSKCPHGMSYIDSGTGHIKPDRHLSAWVEEREVHIDAFCMDQNEVTVADYEQCVREGRCQTPKPIAHDTRCNYTKLGRQFHPMNCVSYEDARQFCEARGKRLPLEDEWLYAAQGGDRHYRVPWGTDSELDRSCLRRWTHRDGTCAVRSYPAEAFGLFDMSGNVREATEYSCDGRPCPPDLVEKLDNLNTPDCGGNWSDEEPRADMVSHGGKANGASGGGFRCAKGAAEGFLSSTTLPKR
jgi:formylglycine-generating enzyme required for sulfatase activity